MNFLAPCCIVHMHKFLEMSLLQPNELYGTSLYGVQAQKLLAPCYFEFGYIVKKAITTFDQTLWHLDMPLLCVNFLAPHYFEFGYVVIDIYCYI